MYINSVHVWLGGDLNVFYFHPYLGKIPILTNIFKGVETTNQMTCDYLCLFGN